MEELEKMLEAQLSNDWWQLRIMIDIDNYQKFMRIRKLVLENLSLALTSKYPYIRELTTFIKEYEDGT